MASVPNVAVMTLRVVSHLSTATENPLSEVAAVRVNVTMAAVARRSDAMEVNPVVPTEERNNHSLYK